MYPTRIWDFKKLDLSEKSNGTLIVMERSGVAALDTIFKTGRKFEWKSQGSVFDTPLRLKWTRLFPIRGRGGS